jgi:hypothetical protein
VWLCSPSVRESDHANGAFRFRFSFASCPNLPTHPPTHPPSFVCSMYRKKSTDLWKKVLGFHAKVTAVQHIGASSGIRCIFVFAVSSCWWPRVVVCSYIYLGAFVTKHPCQFYHLARAWAVVAENSMVEELHVAQVPYPTLCFSVKRNVQSRFVVPYLTFSSLRRWHIRLSIALFPATLLRQINCALLHQRF